MTKDVAREWMLEALEQYQYGQALDLANDCCCEFKAWENTIDYSIPQWMIELADELLG